MHGSATSYSIAAPGGEILFREMSRLKVSSPVLGLHYLVSLEDQEGHGARVLVRQPTYPDGDWVSKGAAEMLRELLGKHELPIAEACRYLEVDLLGFQCRHQMLAAEDKKKVARELLDGYDILQRVSWRFYGDRLTHLAPVRTSAEWSTVVEACVSPCVQVYLKLPEGLPFRLALNRAGHLSIQGSVLGFIRWADRNKVCIQDQER